VCHSHGLMNELPRANITPVVRVSKDFREKVRFLTQESSNIRRIESCRFRQSFRYFGEVSLSSPLLNKI
jgi:hypothetical protein